MPVFIIVSIISMIALWFLSLQMTLTELFEYDILKNEGHFSLFFFGISVFKVKVKILSFDAKTRRVSLQINKKVFVTSFTPETESDSILNYITMPLFSIIDFIYINAHFRFGYKNDAFLTMLAVETVQIASYAFLSVLKSSQELKISESFVPVYGKDDFSFDFDGIITVSIANIIYSVFFALGRKLKKREKSKSAAKEMKEGTI